MKTKNIRDRTKLIAKNYDQSLLAIETILGMASEMSIYISNNKQFEEVPKEIKYAIGITAIFLNFLFSKSKNINTIQYIDLSEIENLDEKFEILIKHLSEVIEDWKNKN